MPTTTFRVLFFHIPTHSQLMIEEYNYSRKKNKNQAHFSRGSTLQQKWSWLPWQESLSRALSQSSTAAWCTKLEHPSQLGQVSDQIWNKFTCKSRELLFRGHHGLLGWHISNIGSPVVTPEKKKLLPFLPNVRFHQVVSELHWLCTAPSTDQHHIYLLSGDFHVL